MRFTCKLSSHPLTPAVVVVDDVVAPANTHLSHTRQRFYLCNGYDTTVAVVADMFAGNL